MLAESSTWYTVSATCCSYRRACVQLVLKFICPCPELHHNVSSSEPVCSALKKISPEKISPACLSENVLPAVHVLLSPALPETLRRTLHAKLPASSPETLSLYLLLCMHIFLLTVPSSCCC